MKIPHMQHTEKEQCMMIEKRINPVILAQVDLYLNQVDEIPEECIRKKTWFRQKRDSKYMDALIRRCPNENPGCRWAGWTARTKTG